MEDDARAAVLIAASDLSQRVLTYYYDGFEEDVEVAAARLTPAFRGEYEAAMAQVLASTRRRRRPGSRATRWCATD